MFIKSHIELVKRTELTLFIFLILLKAVNFQFLFNEAQNTNSIINLFN